jgi:hypothetical protein
MRENYLAKITLPSNFVVMFCNHEPWRSILSTFPVLIELFYRTRALNFFIPANRRQFVISMAYKTIIVRKSHQAARREEWSNHSKNGQRRVA